MARNLSQTTHYRKDVKWYPVGFMWLCPLSIFMRKFVLYLCMATAFTIAAVIFSLYNSLSGIASDHDNFSGIISENPDLRPPSAGDDEIINWLIMGIDDYRSDTMIVLRLNKTTNKIAAISIPRDTKIPALGKGASAKINSAVARKEGTPLAMATVSDLLGIPIHYYVKMDFAGAASIIDIIGGVEIDVPIDMDYEDPAQNLQIHIKKGKQTLNGENAVKFIRFRHSYVNGDIDRIKAQQQFINAFIDKISSPSVLPKALALINEIGKYVKTNMSETDIAYYGIKSAHFDFNAFHIDTLPGEEKYVEHMWFFIHDVQKTEKLIDNLNRELEKK